MRVCPAGDGKGACACAYGQVPNIRLRPSPQEVHRGGTRLKPKVALPGVRGASSETSTAIAVLPVQPCP